MSLKNLRNLPVKLDPLDHGYGVGRRPERGEIVVERDPDESLRRMYEAYLTPCPTCGEERCSSSDCARFDADGGNA